MTKELFVEKNFQKPTLATIDKANGIITEYSDQGFILTLRQLYYQFVARDLLENLQSEYKKLGTIIKDARRAGLIDWDAIEDRTRFVRRASTWCDPSDIIKSASRGYQEDLWANQEYRPEVWIEKDALVGVIENVCNEFQVPFFACRGNNSESEQYKAGKRFAAYIEDGLVPIVLYLGDHDPPGVDMTRDIVDRLALFANAKVEVKRVALNMSQIEHYSLPPNPAKETDTRYSSYVERFGTTNCWELDALDPTVIVELLREEITDLIDPQAWDDAKAEEQKNRNLLDKVSNNWAAVQKLFVRPRPRL